MNTNEDRIREICELIQDGKRTTEISEITGYSIQHINRIRKQKIHTEISKDYDLTVRARYIKEDIIHQVCQLLEAGTPVKEVSKITGIGTNYIYKIRTGDLYLSISKDYKFKNKIRRKDEDKIRQACELIQKGMSDKEVVEITGFSMTTVWNIRNGYTNASISKDYKFPNKK